jgi:hypothetical protein
VSIYEAIGIGYAFIAVTTFTAQLVYLGAQGLAYMQRLILRGQAEENLDLQRSASIKRELAEVE